LVAECIPAQREKKRRFHMKRKGTIMIACALAGSMLSGASVFAAPAEDGLLRTAIRYDITTMDVAKTTDDYMIPMNVFDRLFETRMTDGTAQVVGSLCTDYTVSEDGLTYDFTLRDGVEFSNGSALTASDVQYTFERLLQAGEENMDIPLEVQGADAVASGEADSLEGFQTADDTHFPSRSQSRMPDSRQSCPRRRCPSWMSRPWRK
jgi:peptide/nickel transport system substrate-binding protein